MTKIGATSGRYTALFIFALACVLVAYWLSLLDDYPLAVMFSAIIVVPFLMASFALLIGLLFSGLSAQEGVRLSRQEAPQIWQIWDEFAGQTRSDRHLIIDDEMNASMGERRKIAGLWGHEVTMRLGLPLMLCLDVPALRAVIAHEVGHNQLQHTSGLANLVEFEKTFETLFEFADPDETVTGAVCYFLLGRLGSWLNLEIQRLSRQHEFEADHIAAAREGIPSEARSMVLTEAASEFYSEEIIAPIRDELTGATKAPRPPMERLVEQLAELRTPERISALAKRCWAQDPDPESTHPTLKERIRAHGLDECPYVETIDEPAADVLLNREMRERLIKELNRDWSELVGEMVRLE